MTHLLCRACGARLTGELRPVTDADRAAAPPVRPEEPAPSVPVGTFAVDPEPFGAPYVPGPGGHRVPGGPAGCVVLHPAESLAVRRHHDGYRLAGCCARDGMQGPNLLCDACGAEVGTLRDDCWVAESGVWLDPQAVATSPTLP
ncbi:hypothetical protein GC089_00420 [Cellulomonas sp. JZ18]|uniref:hypothetical protein n=1 Tax=Cellulomonas sp. JZ18 TaxID=2654191 RepID=UPI0012D4BE7E|nr:hypothetical protein [Cellulomonas sp. JZ18]QGQ18008.1 hypothetical protein GC089_00420 [Cellulomonas sp. JZ18]